jgi:protein-S-isoprenylcysteine O-methyltransferase Ste14
MPGTLVDALQNIARSERALASIAQHLLVLHEYGALQKQDVQTYDTLRVQLYGTQIATYTQLVASLAQSPGGSSLSAQIPVPQIAPAFPVQPNIALHGLGNPIVIAAGGVTLSIPVWAVVIIAVVVVVAAIAIYIATLQVFTASEQIDANTSSVESYYATQERLLRDCIHAGRSASDCAVLVANIAPPSVARPQDPLQGGPGGNPSEWPKWLAIGGTALFGTVLLVWMLPKMTSGSSHEREPRYRLVEST